MAYGLRTYTLYLGGDNTLMQWFLIDDALQRNIVTIAEPGGLADTAAALLDGAALIRARKEILDDAPRAQLERYRAALHAGKRPRKSRTWQAPVRPRLDVRYERPAHERISLQVDAGSEPAVVFVSESHHPWWTARVDGEPVDVLRAQNVFMAVRVGPGRHRIELAFTLPAAVAAADAATRVGWLALVAGLPVSAVTLWRRRRTGP